MHRKSLYDNKTYSSFFIKIWETLGIVGLNPKKKKKKV